MTGVTFRRLRAARRHERTPIPVPNEAPHRPPLRPRGTCVVAVRRRGYPLGTS